MSTKNNTTTQETTTAAPISKERMEQHQQAIATFLGCDAEKKISGIDYLMIFVGALQREGIIAPDATPRCYQAARGMKANNSALRQWLYERSEKTERFDSMSDKYKNLGA